MVLRLAATTSIQPSTAQQLPNYRMLLTHTPVEAPDIPTNRHSPSSYATSFCLKVIRNQNTHWPLSHSREAAVVTSTSLARTHTTLALRAPFLHVRCLEEARRYNFGLYFATKDMQELWASSCCSQPEFLPLNFLAFSDLKRKLFLSAANSRLGKGERKHDIVPSLVAALHRSPLSSLIPHLLCKSPELKS